LWCRFSDDVVFPQEHTRFLFRKYSTFCVLFIAMGVGTGVLAVIWQWSVPILSRVSLFLALYGLLLLTGQVIQATSSLVYWLQNWGRYIWRSNTPPYRSHHFEKDKHRFLPNQRAISSKKSVGYFKWSMLTFAATLLIAIYFAVFRPVWVIWLSGWWVVEAIVVALSILFRVPIAIVSANGVVLPEIPEGFNRILLGVFALNLLFTVPLCSNLSHIIELKVDSLYKTTRNGDDLDLREQIGLVLIIVSVFYSSWVLLGFLFPRLNLLPF